MLNVAQFNYVSRNQLHSKANLNFGLMCKKTHCWALSTNISVQLIVFLDHALVLAELAQNSNYFKIGLWRETELRGIYFYDDDKERFGHHKIVH